MTKFSVNDGQLVGSFIECQILFIYIYIYIYIYDL